MKTEIYNKAILFDWDNCPYLFIEPSEIIKASSNDFKLAVGVYAKALDIVPVCGKQIINLDVWTAIKMWACDCINGASLNNACLVIGSKEIQMEYIKRSYLEIAIVSLEEKYGMKIVEVFREGLSVKMKISSLKYQINMEGENK